MASILIRGISGELKEQLRLRAAAHGLSMEAEARELLKSGLDVPKPAGKEFLPSIRALVEPFGGVELEPYPGGKNSPREAFTSGERRGQS